MTPNDNNPRRPKTRSITAQEENDVSNSDTPISSPQNKAKYYRKIEKDNDEEEIKRPISKKIKMTKKPNDLDTQKMLFTIILDKIMKKGLPNSDSDDDEGVIIDTPVWRRTLAG